MVLVRYKPPPPNPGGQPNPGEVHDAAATHSHHKRRCVMQRFSGLCLQISAMNLMHLILTTRRRVEWQFSHRLNSNLSVS